MMTPEHLQLLSTRNLEAAAHPDEQTSDTEEVAVTGDMARMARFELRRRQCQVPVRNRYDSVALRTAARQTSASA